LVYDKESIVFVIHPKLESMSFILNYLSDEKKHVLCWKGKNGEKKIEERNKSI